jgi:hypothetical protein
MTQWRILAPASDKHSSEASAVLLLLAEIKISIAELFFFTNSPTKIEKKLAERTS